MMAQAAVPLMVAGTLMSAYSARQAGEAQKQEKYYEAGQLEQNAGQTQAAGQIEALNAERNTSLTLSRARAVAAASGGSATDATVVNIMGQLAGRGAYNANMTRYNADARAVSMRNQAAADRFQGEQAGRAGRLNMISTLLTGGGSALSMAQKYGSFGSSPESSDVGDFHMATSMS